MLGVFDYYDEMDLNDDEYDVDMEDDRDAVDIDMRDARDDVDRITDAFEGLDEFYLEQDFLYCQEGRGHGGQRLGCWLQVSQLIQA